MYCTSFLEGVHVFINLVKYVLVGDLNQQQGQNNLRQGKSTSNQNKVNCPAKPLPVTLFIVSIRVISTNVNVGNDTLRTCSMVSD